MIMVMDLEAITLTDDGKVNIIHTVQFNVQEGDK